MAGSAGGKNDKTTQTSSPWSAQVPYLRYGMDEAARLYQRNGPKYYPGSTVAGFSDEQNQAFDWGTQRAMQGNDTMNAAKKWSNDVLNGGYQGDQQAKGYMQDVLKGKYLNSDPYSDTVYQNIQSKVMPSVNSQFMGSGRYGSNMQTDTATRALTESYSPYASQQYQAERDRMGWAAGGLNDMYQQDMGNRQWAAGMAPTWAADDWNNIGALERIGAQKQGLAQNELNDAVARWDYYQRLPYDKLGQFLNNIGGNYGGTVVGRSPNNQPSGWQQAAGAGLGLLGLFA